MGKQKWRKQPFKDRRTGTWVRSKKIHTESFPTKRTKGSAKEDGEYWARKGGLTYRVRKVKGGYRCYLTGKRKTGRKRK